MSRDSEAARLRVAAAHVRLAPRRRCTLQQLAGPSYGSVMRAMTRGRVAVDLAAMIADGGGRSSRLQQLRDGQSGLAIDELQRCRWW